MKIVDFLGKQYVVEGTVGAPDGAIFPYTLPSAELVELRNILVSNMDLGNRIKMFQNKSKGIKKVIELLIKYDDILDDDLPADMEPAPTVDATLNDDLPDHMAPTPTVDEAPAETESAKPTPTGEAAAPKGKVRDGSKQAALIELLKRPEGASIKEIADALNWVNHTARGAISRDLKKRLGLPVTKSRIEGRGQVYRIAS